jgi:leucyl-tRNA synthetase
MDKNNSRKIYNPKDIEQKWVDNWEENKIYVMPLTKDFTEEMKSKKKMHVLDMLPYPSGEGLHTGHAKVFGASDIYTRMKRMQGYNVLHVTGWDAFGLPAEQYAIKMKINPKISVKKNTENFEKQMKMLGLSYDWTRTSDTTDPKFYKHTQWIFKQLYKAGLCYESFEPINWCPSCKTGLANEDLEDGKCERCGSVVEKKPIRQWVIKITDYAEKLLQGVDNLNWKESIKEMQRNWIGKSVGSEIDFQIKKENIPVRPIYVDNVQPPKEGIKTTNRNGVLFIVKHWSEEKYLLNISEQWNWKILFTGGIDPGESPYEATKREVLEETGYKNIKSIKKINFSHTDNFYRVHKGDNAMVEQTNMIVELADGEQLERTPEEAAAHKLEWHTAQEMSEIIDRRNHKFVFDYCVLGDDSKFESVFGGYKKQDYLGANDIFTVFTTRPDTLFGCTYCVFAPEHKLVKDYLDKNFISNKSEVEKYIADSKNKSEIDRTAVGKEKTGVKLEGIVAVNPANGREVPVYIADFCLANYGTGALMAVPAHDERDYEFAKKFNLEITKVVESEADKNNPEINTEYGKVINSGKFDGLESEEAKKQITKFVGGNMVTKYKLRDWVFARQRYWGEPFPVVFGKDENSNHKSYLVADSELPIVLPDVESYEPTGNGESPLADIKEFTDVYGYLNSENEFVSCDPSDANAKLFKRETNTMPQWAGSSWYWLRYMDPHNENIFVSKKEEEYWGQVDIYLGGMEHATRHLIYGRFWNQFLYDKKYLSVSEPFQRLEAVGLVLGKGGVKMSKRLGNVVNPDDVVKQFGADTLRLYIAFAGDYHDSFAWDEKSIVGPRRFIERVWDMQYKIPPTPLEGGASANEELETLLNQTIKKVGEDYELLKFNTAVAQMMIFANTLEKTETVNLEYYKTLLKLLAPICPFVTEEIWNSLVEKNSIHTSTWPKYDENNIQNKTVNIAVQIGGKLRDMFTCVADLSDEELVNFAKNTEGYKKWVGDAEPKKIIVIKNKIVNIVL